ncbi:hypothetical protein Tsubulata_038361, partial [Turnera subulata]
MKFELQSMLREDRDGVSGPHWKGDGSSIFDPHHPEVCMIPVRALNIVWGNDPRFWKPIKLSELETMFTGFNEGVMLLQVNWIEVTGKLSTSNLMVPPNTKCEVRYVMKFQVDAFGWHSVPIKFKVSLNGKETLKSVLLEPYKEKHGVWHEISGGEFTFPGNSTGAVEFVLLEVESSWWKGGMEEGSQYSQPTEELGHSESQNQVEKPAEVKLNEAKSKTVEKASEIKLQPKAEEKPAADAKISETKAKAAAALKHPHNYEAILRDADSVIDRTSVDKLYDQLYTGVFLKRKRQKYWVEKKSHSNCFTLFARDLLITWAEDNRLWHWFSLYETSNVSVDVAELINVCWLEVHGKFNTIKLTPGVLYEAVFVIMLKDPAYGWETPVNLRVILPNGVKQEHKEKLLTKPRAQWIEIPAGEFKVSPEHVGEMEISMFEYDGGDWKKGLLIKGIVIRPKDR